MPDITIHHTPAAAAEVNIHPLVTLYDASGEAIQVEAAKVDTWIARGFSRETVDLEALLADVRATAAALPGPWQAYVDACQQGGAVDNAAQDVARVVLDDLAGACQRLHLALHRSFPVAQQEN